MSDGILVLTRKPGEVIYAYPRGRPDLAMAITLIGFKGTQARLGFAASRDITIMREEIVPEDYLAAIPPEIRQWLPKESPEKPLED